jgi:arylsulfatase A-like enzyme
MPPMPAPADVEQLGPVIDRYMMWLDQQVGELVAAFSTPPNVLIVSDHGEGATNSFALWRGWHTAEGIFIVSGPGVPRTPGRIVAQYTDVVPTMLQLLNLRPAPDLSGQIVGAGGHASPGERAAATHNQAGAPAE